jgi:hypothetical protein
MNDITYRLVFTGQIRPGVSVEEAKARTATLFRLPEPVVDMLFSGGEQIVKKNGSRKACENIKAVLDRAGAVSRIEREIALRLEPRLDHPYHRQRSGEASATVGG